MYYESELRFLEKMLEKCHINYMRVDPNAPLDSVPEYSRVFPFKSKELSEYTLYDVVSNINPATVYRLMDVFLCRYILFKLPFVENEEVFLIGPYLNEGITKQQIMEEAERMSCPANLKKDLELFYGSIPVMSEEYYLFAMVNTFAEYLWNGEENFESEDLYFNQTILFLSNQSQNRIAIEGRGDKVEIMEDRYRFENELIEAVSQGNTHKAELMIANISRISLESRTADPLRNLKNYCIIINTLMRKAAEKGQVHPVHLDRVSSEMAYKIEALRSVSFGKEFMIELLRTYCRLVRKHSLKQYSPLVQKTMILIEEDLTEDLTLQAVAERNNISPGYLSGLFKKETGKSFTTYVNSRRVSLAKHLLKNTHLQIQTVAQHCGILDFHYFCRLFKKATGKTPTEYRNDHLGDTFL